MKVLIYYENTQQSLFEKLSFTLSSRIEYLKRVNSIELLKEHYNADECPVMIILSQPSLEYWTELTQYNFTQVMVYIGVRVPKSTRLENMIFSDEFEFEDKYRALQKEQKNNIIRKYLSYLGPLDDEDKAYLELDFKLTDDILKLPKSRLPKSRLTKSKLSTITKKHKPVKKGIVSVIGTAREVIDFGVKVNQHVHGKVIIVDGNLMKPMLDDALCLKSLYSDIKSHLIGIDNTGINIALDMIAKRIDSEEELMKCTKWISPNLYAMLGNYNLYNYEHYDDGLIKILVRKLAQLYDIVILHVCENPYDVFTMLALHESDVNLVHCSSHISQMRYVNSVIDILNYKQGISREKTLVAASKTKGVKSLHKQVFKKQFVGSSLDKVVQSVLETI